MKVSERFQPAIDTVVDEKSESKVPNTQILKESPKISEEKKIGQKNSSRGLVPLKAFKGRRRFTIYLSVTEP